MLCVAYTLFKRKIKIVIIPHDCKAEGIHIKSGFLHAFEKALTTVEQQSLMATIGT